mgnify:CR=1 FL=1
MSDLMFTEEVSAKCRVPEPTLRWWRHVGTGPKSFRLGRRVVYKRADVEAWIEEQYQASVKEPA